MGSKQLIAPARLATMVLILSSMTIPAQADIIYLLDGNIMMVEKAWEEGNEIKYKTSGEIRSLPKSGVREIRQETASASPSSQKWTLSPESSGRRVQAALSGAASPTLSQEALKRLRDNLKATPSERAKMELVVALNSAASLEMAQGNLAAAMAALEEALGLDERNPAILSNLAIIYLQMGDYRSAEELLRECLQINDRDQRIHYLMGEAYYGQEKIPQAIAEWNQALQFGPNSDITKRLAKAQQEAGIHNDLAALQSTHFILRYDQKVSDQQLGRQILATLETLYSRLSNELTSQGPATVAVIVYPNQTYFDVTRAPSWSGALFDGKIRIPIKGLTTVTPELRATLIHELTHSFIASLPGRGCPAWFNEGVALLQEGQSAASLRAMLTELHQSNRLIHLSSLQESFTTLKANAADVAYAESLAAVEHIVAHFGKPAIKNILELMAQNYNFENAFNTALRRSVSDFEAEWERSLMP
jgi:tetratricopeptide (TPR) repeat protein